MAKKVAVTPVCRQCGAGVTARPDLDYYLCFSCYCWAMKTLHERHGDVCYCCQHYWPSIAEGGKGLCKEKDRMTGASLTCCKFGLKLSCLLKEADEFGDEGKDLPCSTEPK